MTPDSALQQAGWRRVGWALALLALLSLGARALAADYRIGLGDTLAVTVTNHDDFGGTVTVAADGTIRLPVVEQVQAAGLTLDALTARLCDGYKRRLLTPEVFVKLVSTRPTTAYVLGAVKAPGAYPLTGHIGALELITAAGGLLQAPTACRATLLHKASGERQPVALADLLAGNQAADLPIQDGDILLIEPLPTVSVYLTGELAAPGLYELPEGATLTQALARAGGIRGELAERCAVITRGNETITRAADALYRPPADDVPLQQGDVISVESTLITVTLAGDVTTPGSYTMPRGTGLADALHLAGGALPTARLQAITVTHADGQQEIVNLPALAAGAGYALRDGDHIAVPTSLVGVTLQGEVKLPGTYQVAPRMNLADLVTLAGGGTPVAALGEAKLVHLDGTVEQVDLGAAGTANLREGDRIIVPASTERIAVLGNVRNPGYFAIDSRHPYTVSEAVIRAGGVLEHSAAAKTTLVRVENGAPREIPINLEKLLRTMDRKDDLTLQPGDVIYVPKSSALRLNELLGTLSTVSLLRGLFGGF